MDFDNDLCIGSMGELHRLDVRIDCRPLACPIPAHSIASVDMPAFHSICPHNILVHGREHALYVASVEPIVNVLFHTTLNVLHRIHGGLLPILVRLALAGLILPASPFRYNAEGFTYTVSWAAGP